MNINPAQLLAPWNNQQMRNSLRQRLKQIDTTPIQTTDQSLQTEYFRHWLEIPSTKPFLRLIKHPLLLKSDKQLIDTYIFEQETKQKKYAGLFTLISVGFYWVLLRRKAVFQRMFNERQRWWVWNGMRKVLATYAIFIGWMAATTSHYEHQIPRGLNQKGFFQKYQILFQEKFV